jgi:hypothetical protein
MDSCREFGRNLPGSQGAANRPVAIQKPAREKGLRWGESLTAEKMKQRWVKPKLVCQPELSNGPMPAPHALHLRCHGIFSGLPGL